MKRFAKILLFGLPGLIALSQAPWALGQITSNIDCRISPISGPVERTTESVKYIFSPGKYADDPDYECTWTIGDKIYDTQPCQVIDSTFSINDRGNKVSVELRVNKKSDATNLVCQTNDEFTVGDRRQIIERKLENQYPVLPGNFRISPSTLPSQLIRYVFVLALSAIGLVALFSLIVSGASWVIGDQERAKKMLGNVATGIVLLLSVYVIINFVNPELLKIKDPVLPQINIQFDERLKNILKKCRELGIKADCSVYDGDAKACMGNYCSVADGPCVYSGSACIPVGSACKQVNSCPEYQTVSGIAGPKYSEYRRLACQTNACGLTGGCVAYSENISNPVGFECLSPDEAKKRQGEFVESSQTQCQNLIVTKCIDYKDATLCSTNACGDASRVQGAPCIWSSGACLNKDNLQATCTAPENKFAGCNRYNGYPFGYLSERKRLCETDACGASTGSCVFVANRCEDAP